MIIYDPNWKQHHKFELLFHLVICYENFQTGNQKKTPWNLHPLGLALLRWAVIFHHSIRSGVPLQSAPLFGAERLFWISQLKKKWEEKPKRTLVCWKLMCFNFSTIHFSDAFAVSVKGVYLTWPLSLQLLWYDLYLWWLLCQMSPTKKKPMQNHGKHLKTT